VSKMTIQCFSAFFDFLSKYFCKTMADLVPSQTIDCTHVQRFHLTMLLETKVQLQYSVALT